MSHPGSWGQRKAKLSALLGSTGDEDADGVALDRLMHGQNVIGKTAKTREIDSLRFRDKDLKKVGTLEYGQYGVIDVVTCRLNRSVYVRKSIEKVFALRTRDQCFPQFERDILLRALKTQSPWAPHLLCAFQTPTHLNLVMDYAEGGTLWDVLESSPHDSRIPEEDMMWWIPQVVSAIHWCHDQGFVHRDIKPHNFVLTTTAHLLLIDFGSAAPLLPPNPDGSQQLPKQYCLVPCGTCDYISPEILQAHEAALVALEMDDEGEGQTHLGKNDDADEEEGYGLEADWWSLGAMLYEMAYGVAPFFAPDVRQTYSKIMNHEKSLRFDQSVPVSHEYQHFLRRLLTHPKKRLGRRNVMEITDHPLFKDVDWLTVSSRPAPPTIHLPQFTYTEPNANADANLSPDPIHATPQPSHTQTEESLSQGFPFSAFFQSSNGSSPGLSVLRASGASLPSSRKDDASAFIGFSWGPTKDAFPDEVPPDTDAAVVDDKLKASSTLGVSNGSAPASSGATLRTPLPASSIRGFSPLYAQPIHHTPRFSTPRPASLFPAHQHQFITPSRPYSHSPGIYATLPRTGTIRRTLPRRNVSDREAMKQLVDCVGMSARKKVLESGRKLRVLSLDWRGATEPGNSMRLNQGVSNPTNGTAGGSLKTTNSGKTSSGGTLRKELRFDPTATPIPAVDYSAASTSVMSNPNATSTTATGGGGSSSVSMRSRLGPLSFNPIPTTGGSNSNLNPKSNPDSFLSPFDQSGGPLQTSSPVSTASSNPFSDEDDDDHGYGLPPSPSPSPRPGSALSMMSRRSGVVTPTATFNLTNTLTRQRSLSLLGPGSAGVNGGGGHARARSGSGSVVSVLVPNQSRSASGGTHSRTPSLVRNSVSAGDSSKSASASASGAFLAIPTTWGVPKGDGGDGFRLAAPPGAGRGDEESDEEEEEPRISAKDKGKGREEAVASTKIGPSAIPSTQMSQDANPRTSTTTVSPRSQPTTAPRKIRSLHELLEAKLADSKTTRHPAHTRSQSQATASTEKEKELETRYRALLRDISDLEARLADVKILVNGDDFHHQ